MKSWSRATGAAGMIVCLAAGCSSASSNGGDFASSPGSPGSGGSGSGGSSGGSSLGGSDSGPPEVKAEGDYQSPVATGQYVWIANPTSGRVAYIQASTLEVATVAAGNGPTYLAAVPNGGADTAIVLNVLSHDATLLTAASGGLTTTSFPVALDANAWAISGDGHWAIAWGNSSLVSNPDPTQGFQDVSAIDLTGKAPPTILAVGYRPVTVGFAGDASHAFAVTQDGVSVIDLGGAAPLVTANFPVSTDPNQAATSDVSITPDGAYALVRWDNQSTVNVVALSDGTLTSVALPANATDLTLTPSGDQALVVMRDIATVAVLPIPQIATDPTTFSTIDITGQTVGRALVADDGQTTLLFTTVLPVDFLSVLDLSTQAVRSIKLYAPLYAVFPTPDSKNAIVVHSLPPDAGTSSEGAFSVVPVGADLPAKIVGTAAPPNAVALSPAGDRAVVTARDDSRQIYEAYLTKLPSLEVDQYTLASPPIGAGVVAGANRAYVAQSNAEGRITFIDLGTGLARTLTGFELESRVVDGSQP